VVPQALPTFGCSQVCWAADHTLASASERDNVVRMYNFDTEDNYVLTVSGVSSHVNSLAVRARVCCCQVLKLPTF
jgi:hypothetical protein